MMRAFLWVALWMLASALSAKVTLPALCGNHMVLQQNTDVVFWGVSDCKRVEVKASWCDKTFRVQTDEKGKFSVIIPTFQAGGPYEITFSDGEILKLSDVWIGEVWICSGQSNMDMPMIGFPNQPVEGALDFLFDASNYPIHIFTITRELSDVAKEECQGRWETSSPLSVSHTSATAYFYARYLHRVLGVPVGIIVSSWGGTSILSWMSSDAVKKIPTSVVENCVARDSRPQNIPSNLYHSMIYPLKNYKARGFIWYQGEHNLQERLHYDSMMKAMVESWRNLWGVGASEMPFYYVQITPWRYFNNSAGIERPLLVEAQKRALGMIPHSDMATTTDIGDENCIHPAKKKEVGERLAICALKGTYSMGEWGANLFEKPIVSFKGKEAFLSFPSLKLGNLPRRYTGFEVAGADRAFYPAEAVVRNGKITVSAEEVEHPVALRYAFRNYIECSLTNELGIDYPSFRTDDWE